MIMSTIGTSYWVILLILAIFAFIFFLFLPSILELKRPKDPGPRKIAEITTEKGD